MATKRITELGAVDAASDIAPNDLFLLSDVDQSQSKKVTLSTLKDAIIDASTFTRNRSLIVAALNGTEATPSTANSNGLRASSLFVPTTDTSGTYQPASYFLTYSNLAGRPVIPTRLDQLTNSTGCVRYSTSSGKMIYDVDTSIQMSSDFVNEGLNNLFFTDARVDARVNELFPELFNIFSSTFDQGGVVDSLISQPGVFIATAVPGVQTQSKIIRIIDNTKRQNFLENQYLRLYCASARYSATTNLTVLELNIRGFLDTAAETGRPAPVKFSYKITEFDIQTGDISPASAAVSKDIRTPANLAASVTTLQAFNSTNFIRLSFTGTPVGKVIAVNRQVANTGNFKLIAILGRKEVDVGSWIDYYTYDYTSWSGKSAIDNSFTSIIHFPLTAPDQVRRGWVDRRITKIDERANYFDITLDDSVFVNPGLSVSVCHNDTSIIRDAINSNSVAGKKSIILNAKTYNASQLALPNNFGFVGTPYITKIKKLPWSGGEAGIENSKLITTLSPIDSTGISIVGVDIDGDFQNQFLFADSTTPNRNFLLDFGIGTNSLLIDKVRVTN
jgi:hypothetical protein